MSKLEMTERNLRVALKALQDVVKSKDHAEARKIASMVRNDLIHHSEEDHSSKKAREIGFDEGDDHSND